jgi:DNA-binding LytR/AlgR family response regulator
LKVNKYKDNNLKEEHIDIYYSEHNSEARSIIDYLESKRTIVGRNEKEQCILKPLDIYYCEVVDKKNFAYLENQVFQIDMSIQSMIEQFSDSGFIRVSKSMIVNIYKINKLKADINMRVNIQMDNGEVVVMNRSYKKAFYQFLKNMEGGLSNEENE